MYVIIAGAGKVGRNLARELISKQHEVTLIECSREHYLGLEEEFEHAVQYGDATELWILERSGIQRADLVIAVTGDDEDNMLVCQVAKEKYLVDRIIARVNNPRNHAHFKLLGIQPAVSATDLILRLIAREEERLEIIELGGDEDAPTVGETISNIKLPEGSLIISVLRQGAGFVPKPDTVIEAGDGVLLVLNPGLEEAITAYFAPDGRGE
jgi:trk system potassium uptake protein TrkA